MTKSEEQQIIQNYKYYLEKILEELKEYNDRINQAKINNRYIENPCGIDGAILIDNSY